tara:strand:+ start:922 stop:1200 length:279 start_codon:yes stop_codon:yes gene_type:complete
MMASVKLAIDNYSITTIFLTLNYRTEGTQRKSIEKDQTDNRRSQFPFSAFLPSPTTNFQVKRHTNSTSGYFNIKWSANVLSGTGGMSCVVLS